MAVAPWNGDSSEWQRVCARRPTGSVQKVVQAPRHFRAYTHLVALVRRPPVFSITSYEGLNHLPASILVVGAGFSLWAVNLKLKEPPQTT